jgi:type II secretory pathway pseudopilin PulG
MDVDIRNTAGYTLLETLAAMGILLILAATAIGSLRAGRGDLELRTAQASVLRALEDARVSAIAGIDDADFHGVRISGEHAIERFERESGTDTALGEERLPLSVTVGNVGSEVAFSRLSGQTDPPASIVLTHGSAGSAEVHISHDGLISY